jgi:hypothetical protein
VTAPAPVPAIDLPVDVPRWNGELVFAAPWEAGWVTTLERLLAEPGMAPSGAR